MDKTKLLKYIGIVVLSIYSSSAQAFQRDGKVYVDLNIGYGLNEVKRNITVGSFVYNFKENNKGMILNGGLGYYLLDEVRVGLSLLYASKLRSSGSGSSYADELKEKKMGAFLDVYYDFLTGTKFNPFVLAGIGSVKTEYKQKLTLSGITDNSKKSKTHSAYKLGGGLSYHLNTSTDIDLTYSAILNRGNSKVNLQYTQDLVVFSPTVNLKPETMQSLMVGLRYTF